MVRKHLPVGCGETYLGPWITTIINKAGQSSSVNIAWMSFADLERLQVKVRKEMPADTVWVKPKEYCDIYKRYQEWLEEVHGDNIQIECKMLSVPFLFWVVAHLICLYSFELVLFAVVHYVFFGSLDSFWIVFVAVDLSIVHWVRYSILTRNNEIFHLLLCFFFIDFIFLLCAVLLCLVINELHCWVCWVFVNKCMLVACILTLIVRKEVERQMFFCKL